MTTSKKLITADELLHMPDDNLRHELVRGELITMPLNDWHHGGAAAQILMRFGNFIRSNDLGRCVGSCGFWLEQGPDTVLSVDYAFISHARWGNRKPKNEYPTIMPDLAVEVVSIFDELPYIDSKTRMWLDAGVRLVLNVYPETQEIYAHHDDATVQRFGIDDTLTCEPVLPGFACPVADIFTY